MSGNIPDKIREARLKAGLTQKELAIKVCSSESRISKIETGRLRIDAEDLAYFSEVLETPLTYFF